MGLNEAYDATKRQVLMLKPLPSIEEVFNMVCQDERQRILKPLTSVENVAFQTSVSSVEPDHDHFAAYSNYKMRSRPVCTHCGMTGHVVTKCYKLHGYPPGYEGYRGSSKSADYVPKTQDSYTRPAAQQSSQAHAKAYYKENTVAQVVNDVLVAPNMPSASSVTSNRASLDLSSFSSAQVQQLISQLNAHFPQESSTSHSSPSITEHGMMACNATA
ncbi:hypothetical protein N665_0070s0015, partial [Sinapis alba]